MISLKSDVNSDMILVASVSFTTKITYKMKGYYMYMSVFINDEMNIKMCGHV